MLNWRVTRFNKVLIALSLVSAGVSLTFLARLKPGEGGGPKLEAAGNIESFERDVRRRSAQSLIWMPVEKDMPLRISDTVFTGEDSYATIQSFEGGLIHLEPLTMVVIDKTGGRISLDLKVGSASVDLEAGKQVALVVDGQAVDVNSTAAGTKMKIEREDGAALQIKSLKGTLTTSAGNKPASRLSKGEQLDISKSSVTQKKAATLALRAPGDGEKIWLNAEEETHFTWEDLSANGGPYKIRIAHSRDPKAPAVVSASVEQPKFSAHLPGDETYYWSVTTALGDRASGMFQRIANSAPHPTYPPDDFRLETAADTAEAVFSWQPKPTVPLYQLQLAQDEKFSKFITLDAKTSTTTSSVANGLNYFWRVKVAGRSEWSAARKLTVAKAAPLSQSFASTTPEPPPLVKPVSTLPEMKTAALSEPEPAEPSTTKESSARPTPPPTPAATPLPTPPPLTPPSLAQRDLNVVLPWGKTSLESLPLLEWKKSENAERYRLQIAAGDDFKAALLNQRLQETSFRWANAHPGNFRWRVTAVGAPGTATVASETGTLHVTSEPPPLPLGVKRQLLIRSPKDLGRLPSPIEISWPPSQFASRYTVQTSPDPDFARVQMFNTAKSPVLVPFTNDTLMYVRLLPLNESGSAISEYSRPLKVDVVKKFIIAKPEIEQPGADVSAISMGKQLKPILFVWRAPPLADGYDLQIALDAEFTKIVVSPEPKKPQFVLKQALPEGQLYWRLRAKFGEHESEWTETRTIQVSTSEGI